MKGDGEAHPGRGLELVKRHHGPRPHFDDLAFDPESGCLTRAPSRPDFEPLWFM